MENNYWTTEALNNITDEELDKLGEEFVHSRIQERCDVTFSQFVELKKTNQWERYLKQREQAKNPDDSVVDTKLNLKQVQFLEKHFKDIEVRQLAADWLKKYEEVQKQAKGKENILRDASAPSHIR